MSQDYKERLRESLGIRVEGFLRTLADRAKLESPIEQLMDAALFFYSRLYGQHVQVDTQFQIGGYRVDFVVYLKPRPKQVSDGRCHHCNRELTSPKKRRYCSKSCYYKAQEEQKEVCVIVECDGHDFHEKTKEQASRDKQRDRVLQQAGYHVLHFTGSDIWRDALGCASEVVKFLKDKSSTGKAIES